MSKNLLLSVSVCSLIALVGCQSTQTTAVSADEIENARGLKASSSENILKAEGSWDLVEQQSVTDPMDMHKNARKGVNPANKAKKEFYSKDRLANVDGTNGEVDTRFRLIRMERNPNSIQNDLIFADKDIVVAEADAGTLSDLDFKVKPPKKPLQYKRLPTAFKTVDAAPLVQMENKRTAMVRSTVQNTVPDIRSPSVKASDATVNSIRFGEHPGKTRMVLDLTGASSYKADVDNAERILFIELTAADWGIDREKIISHPLVAGYATEPSKNGGTTLALKLKKPVRILGSAALSPSSSKGHRIYLDIAAG